MKFDNEDFKRIREFCLENFKDFKVDPKVEHLFLTRCFTEAVITFLVSEGFEIVKKKEDSTNE